MSEALVTPEVLRWARKRAGLQIRDVGEKVVPSNPERILEWESGVSRPTFHQAEKFARVTHVPFGTLFLPEPPVEKPLIPDLRTVPGALPVHLDVNFKDKLRDIMFKFDWYKEYRIEHGCEALPFVGRFSPPVDPILVASDIRQTLNLPTHEQMSSDEDTYFRKLVNAAEEAGLWVLRDSIVGGNTHRPIGVDACRGFAICDSIAPLIFINSSDAKAAQIFTLIHEMAHIWLGESGISDPFQVNYSVKATDKGVEGLCNTVAAEFLMPRHEFCDRWNSDYSLEDNVSNLAAAFRVSYFSIYIRARTLNLINNMALDQYMREERQRWANIRVARRRNNGGGDYYRTSKARNGERFYRAVLAGAMSGKLLFREAATLLDMSPAKIKVAYDQMRGGSIIKVQEELIHYGDDTAGSYL